MGGRGMARSLLNDIMMVVAYTEKYNHCVCTMSCTVIFVFTQKDS